MDPYLVSIVMLGHLTDLGVAVPEVERHDLLVDLLLPEHRLIVLQAAVHEAGVVGVESVQMQRRLGEDIFSIKLWEVELRLHSQSN